jgi:uncharacterized membrane protein
MTAWLLAVIALRILSLFAFQDFRRPPAVLGIMAKGADTIFPDTNFLMLTSGGTQRTAHLLLIFFSGALSLFIVGAPWLASHAYRGPAEFLYLFFSPVCHQMPQRSFALRGMPWAVCHRCAGIYIGLFAGSLLPLRWRASAFPAERRRTWVLAASGPLLLDVVLPYAGLWSSTAASRFLTGFVFGVMLMTLLLPGTGEILRDISLRRSAGSHAGESQGGVR